MAEEHYDKTEEGREIAEELQNKIVEVRQSFIIKLT